MATQTPTLDKLQEALATLDQQYHGTYTTPEAVYALMKTIKTFNITITDWNTLIKYINTVGLTLDALYAVVPELVDAIDSIPQIFNVEDGAGTNAVQEKMADATVDFTDRNPNAETLDPTISTTINTGASGNQSSAFGKNTMALATASFTNGNKTIAKGEESHAEGYQSVTLGDGSHAEGQQTVSEGDLSHAEGLSTITKGQASHSEGCNTEASGLYSHAEGQGTKAIGPGSHAEGYNTEATSSHAHSSGVGTMAGGGEGQFVTGKYNLNKMGNLFEIGNGSSNEARQNAFEVHEDGHAEVQTAGATDKSVINREALNQVVTNINEKLEGKKHTYIINTTHTVQQLKTWINSGMDKVENSLGTDITHRIVDGDFDNVTVVNNAFNDGGDLIKCTKSEYLIVLKPTAKVNLSGTGAQTYVLDTPNKIFEIGDVILVTDTTVPDRWFGGSTTGRYNFYALETRKIDLTNVAKLNEDNTFTGFNIFENEVDIFPTSTDFEGNSALYVTDGEVMLGGGLVDVMPDTINLATSNAYLTVAGHYVETEGHREHYGSQSIYLYEDDDGNQTSFVIHCSYNDTVLFLADSLDGEVGELYFGGATYIKHGEKAVSVASMIDVQENAGTKLYLHTITVDGTIIEVISSSSTQYLGQGTVLNAYVKCTGGAKSKQGYIWWASGTAQIGFTTLDGSVSFDIKNPLGAQWTQWDIKEI